MRQVSKEGAIEPVLMAFGLDRGRDDCGIKAPANDGRFCCQYMNDGDESGMFAKGSAEGTVEFSWDDNGDDIGGMVSSEDAEDLDEAIHRFQSTPWGR